MRHITGQLLLVWIVVAAVGLAALAVQRLTNVALQREVVRLRESNRELVQPLAENRRLKALQISDSQRKTLSADQAEVERLRAEVANIYATIQARMTSRLVSQALTARGWRNIGTATPGAAVETILWAAAGGDVDLLTELMDYSPEARAEAEGLYADLPEAVRAKYASPEQLIASLTAKDVPLTAVNFTGGNGNGEKMSVQIHFFNDDGAPTLNEISLSMVRSPGGWRLMVPPSAVVKYRAMLKGAPAGVENKIAR